MNRIFLFFCCGAALASCNNNDTKVKTAQAAAMNTDVVQQNLKGMVKSITESTINIDSAGKQKPDSLTRVTDFDEKGYETVSLQKNDAGKVVSEDFMSRRPDGVVTEFGTKKNGKTYSRVVTEIDKDGKYIGGQSYDSTEKQDGYYKDLAQNEYSIVYAGKHYGMNNKIKETWDMKYDKNHFLGGKNTDSTGKATYEGTAKVNDKGDMSEEDYTYVENGKSKHEKKTYKYDNYDDKGNWTQRTAYDANGKPIQIVKRTINYYNQ
jgi:hypothetical protein